MPSVRRVLGLVVLILGVVVVAVSFSGFNDTNATIPAQATNSEAEYPPNILSSGTFTVSWSGAPSATSVSIYSCPDATCSNGPYLITQLSLLSQGSGGSGSLSATVQPGHDYVLIENGSADGLVVTETQTGLTWLGVIGLVLAILGVVLVALPTREVEKKPEPEPEDDVPETVLAPPPKVEMVETPTPVYRPPAASAGAPEVSVSEFGTGAAPSKVMGGATGGARAPIKCASCGTLNEPWLTNCRWCKRTLSVSKTPQ
jgi:hypothetical protein